MKNKTFKKSLAMFLSFLMVLTSLVFVVPQFATAADGDGTDGKQVSGYVTIDPIIYIHGDFTGTHSAITAGQVDANSLDHMMYGSIVADGSYDGEYKTAVSVSDKTLSAITVIDTGATLTLSNGVLTGNLGGGYGSVTAYTADSTATLKFLFSDGTYELRKVAVKPNPVAQHAVVHAEGYNTPFLSSTRYRRVNFEVLAMGSNGQTGGSSSGNSSWTKNENYGSLYAPYNQGLDAWLNSNTLYVDGINSSETLTFDKKAGYVAQQRANNANFVFDDVVGGTALYYLDLSSDKNSGIEHTVGSNDWKITFLVGNLYNASDPSQSPVSTDLYYDDVPQGVTATGGTLSIPTGMTDSGAFNGGAAHYFYPTVSGTATAGSTVDGNLKVALVHVSDTSVRGTITLPFQIKVVDKSSLRDVYNNFAAQKFNSLDYSASTWKAFSDALLAADVYLNDSTRYDATAQASLKTDLETAYDNLFSETLYREYQTKMESAKSYLDNSGIYTDESVANLQSVYDTYSPYYTSSDDSYWRTLSTMDYMVKSDGETAVSDIQQAIDDLVEKTYIIQFNANGGSGEMSSLTVKYTASTALPDNVFTRTGYTFTGWSTTSTGGVTYDDGATVSMLSATNGATVTLYAVWSPITYNVQYVTNGADEEISGQSAAYDTSFNLPTPTKTGYSFVGWYTASDFSGTSYSAGQNVSNLATAAGATVTLYAKWSPITYTISFDANGGEAVNDVTASYDTEYTLPATTQTGKVLTGWMDDAAGTIHSAGTKVKNLTTTDGATVTFTAQWDVATYTVTFMHWDNVTVLDTQTVKYGGTATYGGGTPAVTYDESNHFTWNNTWTGASLTNVTENRTVLAGYTSTPHTYSTHTSDANATVTDGVASGTHDDKCDCGYVKADQACTFESVTTDATCTDDGSIVYTCSDCGNTVTETIDASHDFTAEIADEKYLHTPGSCTVDAFYYYACSACGDSSNDDSLKWQAAAPGHQFVANDDNTNILTRSNPTTGAKEHRYSCAACGTAGGETANPWVACSDADPVETAPTCEAAGSFAHTCDTCAQTWTTAGDAATGHSKSDAADANWIVTTAPTCEDEGEKTAYCTNVNNGTVCGVVIGTAVVDATGHAYTSEVTTKATCEADGVRTYTCPNTGCETPSYTETIAKRGHSWGDWQTVTEATFTQDGLAERYCQNTTATDTHEACSAREEQVLTAGDDTTPPTGEIKWGTSVWNSFLSAITFGNYTNYDVTLEITAEDAESGVAKIEYFVAEGAYADADALEAAATWTEYDATSKLTVPAVDAQAIVVYAKLTNVDGDVAYINTDGIVFDTTAPVITLSGTGNADTKEYCGAVTVTVTDDNLGEVGNGTYTISTVAPNSQQYENARTTFELTGMAGEWEVTAKDLAGNKTVMTVTVNADHTWATTDTTNLATEATCTAPATYYKVCSVCGAVSDTETFESGDKLGHLEGEWVVTDKADCSTAGSKSIYCTRVNAGETEACGAVLDTEEISARAHTWSTTENDGYVVVSEATCTATGLETRTCVNEETAEYDACEHSESRDIPMIAHDFSDKTDKSAKVSDATCTTGTIYKVGCSACDAVSDTDTWEDTDALGHSFTSGVYDYDTATDKHSQKCANCDVYSAEEACVFGDWAHVEGTNKHKQVCVCGNFNEGVHADAEPVVTAPTCTTDGYTTNVCDVCEYKWTTNPTTKTGHNFTGEYKINADGTHTRKCVNTGCNEYGDSTVCAYGSWTADAENRQHYRKCVCGRTEPIDCATTAHSTSYDATCLANAKTVYECNVCTNEWTKETANTQKDHSYTGAYSPGNAATDTHQRQCVNGCKGWADEKCSFTNNFKASTNEGTTHKHTAECACGNVETLDCFGLPTGMTDATCTTNAYMNYECEDCGNKWSVEQESTKLGHSYTTYETLVAATCKAPGTKVSTCDNGCGTKTTLPIQIDKNNHTGGTEVTGVVTATCQKTGYTGDKKCLGCGTTLETGSIVPLADHDWDNGKTIREANCIGTGVKLYTCKTEGCTKTEEREIAIDPTNHANVQTGVGLDPTCTEPGYTGATECTACHTTIKNGTPIAPLGHEISAWEIIQMPSEDGTQPGIAERCCIRCGGEKETRTDFYIDDVHRVIFHNYDGVRLTQPRYYITGDKAIRPTETPVRVEDDQYTYEFKGWDFSDAELNYVQKEMPVVAQYNAIEKSYAVTFIDASGKVIQTLPGNTPYSQIADSYTGETPTMPSDGVKNYTFSGWGINCDYETGTATVEPVFVGTPIEVEEEEPNEGIFGWLIRWIKQLLASIGINL